MAIDFDAALGLLEAGGVVMYILAALSVTALAIVFDRFWAFGRRGVWRRAAAARALADWQAGRRIEAQRHVAQRRDPVADVLQVALAGRMEPGVDDAAVREEVARRGAAWLESLRGGLRPLELIGTLAPLLGLLGTVIGMIDAFRALSAGGSQVDPAVLSEGIWVALLTTAAGLSVAIPAVAAHTLLERQLERLHHRMQDAATRVFSRDVQWATRRDRVVAAGDSDASASAAAAAPTRKAGAAGAD
jgi:biopolymer transport protein ExbB